MLELKNGSQFRASFVGVDDEGAFQLLAESVNEPIRIQVQEIQSMERIGLLPIKSSAEPLWSVELLNGSVLRGELTQANSKQLSLLRGKELLALPAEQIAKASRLSSSMPAGTLDDERWSLDQGLIFQGGYAYFTEKNQAISYPNLPSQGMLNLGWFSQLAKGGLIVKLTQLQGENKSDKIKVLLDDDKILCKDINGRTQTLFLPNQELRSDDSLAAEEQMQLFWNFNQGKASFSFGEHRIDLALPQWSDEQTSWSLEFKAARESAVPIFALSSVGLMNLENSPAVSMASSTPSNLSSARQGILLHDGTFLTEASLMKFEDVELGENKLRNVHIQTRDGKELIVAQELLSSLHLSLAAEAGKDPQADAPPSWQLRLKTGEILRTNSLQIKQDKLNISLPDLGEFQLSVQELLALEAL